MLEPYLGPLLLVLVVLMVVGVVLGLFPEVDARLKRIIYVVAAVIVVLAVAVVALRLVGGI